MKTTITDIAVVPTDIIAKDKALQETIKTATREIDQHRWESISCDKNDNPIDPKVYAKAVGVAPGVITWSIKAWADHGIGCTNPDHGASAAEKATVPTQHEHAVARVKARGRVDDAEAAVAYAEASGKSLRVLEDAQRDKVTEVIKTAQEIAVSEGLEFPTPDVYGQAARKVAQAFGDMTAKRQKVKVALMENRGTLVHADISEMQVDDAMQKIELNIITSTYGGADPCTWEEAFEDFKEQDKRAHEKEKAEAAGKQAYMKLAAMYGEQDTIVMRALFRMGGYANQFKNTYGITDTARAAFLNHIDSHLAALLVMKEALELAPTPAHADWDKALADLTAGE